MEGYRIVTILIELIFYTKIVHNIKVLVLCSYNYCSRVLAVVMETSGINLYWLVLKNSMTNLFHLWIVHSTQLECARSVIKYRTWVGEKIGEFGKS